jgi:hypothetical protein
LPSRGASVRDSIASTIWSRGCLASMGIAPDARKRSCNCGSLRRRCSRVSPMRPQSLSWKARQSPVLPALPPRCRQRQRTAQARGRRRHRWLPGPGGQARRRW